MGMEVFEFADLRLDPGRHELTRNGKPVPLPKLSFSVLRTLVEAAPDLVSHGELVERAWGPRRTVTRENLAQRLMMLRQALGDDSSEPRYIEGVRGEGYRVVPTVARTHRSPPLQPLRRGFRKWPRVSVVFATLLLAVSLVAILQTQRQNTRSEDGLQADTTSVSIVVLPFANLSPDPDNAFYAAGIHEEILNSLAQLRQLRVLSRTSSLAYAQTTLSLPEIARELDVSAVIEGSVRYSGDRVRVTVQLIDGVTDDHLWAETYDRHLDDIFTIETDVAGNVARALDVTYADAERALVERSPTRSAEAYTDYLRGVGALTDSHYQSGLQYVSSADIDDTLPYALQQFERAVASDPDFAMAHVALSRAHSYAYWYDIDRSDERRHKALASAQRARELQPDLPEARLAMANYLYHVYRDYGGALQELDSVRDQLRSDADLHRLYSYIYRRMGRWEASTESALAAIALDPRHIEILWSQAATFAAMRQYDESRALIERALALAPDMASLWEFAGLVSISATGDTGRARELAERAAATLGDKAEQLLWWDAFYRRDFSEALAILEAHDTLFIDAEPFPWPRASMLGLTHRMLGDDIRARHAYAELRVQLEDALRENPQGRYAPYQRVVLGEALIQLGEPDAGMEEAARGLRALSPSVDAFYGRILQYEALMRIFMDVDPIGRGLPLLDELLSTRGMARSIDGLLPDPRLDVVRDNPRFAALVEKHRR
uniref:Transcriptional regulator n=1 Tax=Haliea sp. ETY-M TaxID=1055105 RepID=A0A455R354_9GAMM|nr:transcriptional regulator [Haliea sp. ETY-M]